MVISNHFLCKDWVHHPIDFQPFIIFVWPGRGFEAYIFFWVRLVYEFHHVLIGRVYHRPNGTMVACADLQGS